jgi:hypothetical protein
MSGEIPQTDHHPPPQGGDEYLVLACGALVWGSAAFRGFSRGGAHVSCRREENFFCRFLRYFFHNERKISPNLFSSHQPMLSTYPFHVKCVPILPKLQCCHVSKRRGRRKWFGSAVELNNTRGLVALCGECAAVCHDKRMVGSLAKRRALTYTSHTPTHTLVYTNYSVCNTA